MHASCGTAGTALVKQTQYLRKQIESALIDPERGVAPFLISKNRKNVMKPKYMEKKRGTLTMVTGMYIILCLKT